MTNHNHCRLRLAMFADTLTWCGAKAATLVRFEQVVGKRVFTLAPCSHTLALHTQQMIPWLAELDSVQVRKRNGSEKALAVNRPVKKIMSPVEAYLDDRGSRKASF